MIEQVKSEIWDIDAIADIRFVKVIFHEEVTKEEAIRRFLDRNFDYYDEIAELSVKKITGAEEY